MVLVALLSVPGLVGSGVGEPCARFHGSGSGGVPTSHRSCCRYDRFVTSPNWPLRALALLNYPLLLPLLPRTARSLTVAVTAKRHPLYQMIASSAPSVSSSPTRLVMLFS